ncbi:MAG: SAM-dependent methyltransferase [Rhodovulum sulfidophilum]|uniref:SAM-dependent methyltransferase n=1 Tax=Rhodovulum sulfidophilum TaxID=35806 RepID=A0A2W5NAX5_RHOSU|nr:MAG: SAM-dependent methyltransferase [Rhodovulum sulfidophilum]
MTRSHDTVVQDQFGPRADAYARSAVHAGGEDLDALSRIVADHAPAHALDLGCGGGHVTYRLARHAARVTAVDLSADMLAAVTRGAGERGLANVATRAAAAEDLPFADGAFDFLACRFSAHHWRDFEAGLRQARRVLRPGSTAVFIDVVSPGPAALDTHLQAVELLRDPSHVRDYAAAEWLAALTRAGFAPGRARARRLRMDYPVWIERMRAPETHQAAIRSIQSGVSREIAAHFEIEPDGSFTIDTAEFEVTAA